MKVKLKLLYRIYYNSGLTSIVGKSVTTSSLIDPITGPVLIISFPK